MSELLKDFCRVCLSLKGSCHHVHQDSSKESFMFNKDVTIDEQCKEITRLKKALEIANEAIGFYANPMTYFSDHEGGGFGYISEDDREDLYIAIKEFNDTEPDFYDEVGGSRAREAQKQIKEIMEG